MKIVYLPVGWSIAVTRDIAIKKLKQSSIQEILVNPNALLLTLLLHSADFCFDILDVSAFVRCALII